MYALASAEFTARGPSPSALSHETVLTALAVSKSTFAESIAGVIALLFCPYRV